MRKRRIHVARPARAKSEEDAEHLRARSHGSDETHAESHGAASGILRLQKSIGNQAVQRLIIERQPQATEEKPKKQRSPGIIASMNVSGTELSDMKLESFNIGASRRSHESSGSEESSEIEVVLTKLQDSASATLHRAAVQGLLIETARFEILREGADGNVETVQTLEFVRGHVSGLSLGGGDPPVEMVQVTFETRG